MTSAVPDAPANATTRAERAALADLLLDVGPDAPTCCTGWATRDLAAHLVLRERRLDAALGIMFSPLSSWTRRVQEHLAAQDYPTLVRQVRTGPPRWSAQSITSIDAASNTVEFFVHHEDVRRATEGWEPRELSPLTIQQLAPTLPRAGKMLTRSSPVGVVVRQTDGPYAGRDLPLRDGPRSVTLVGPVGECVLALFGRPTSGLELQGEDADVEAFRTFPR